MKEVTPISPEIPAAPLPDPASQTELLRAALDRAITALQEDGSALAQTAVSELLALRAGASSPPESYTGLTELDSALCQSLQHIVVLCRHAEPAELQQTLKNLRRTILSDRRRIDPVPERHQIDLAIAIRHAWLIGHRAGLLQAQSQLQHINSLLESEHDSPDDPEQLQATRTLLLQYIAAQEGYGASIRRELDDLNARRSQ